MACDLWFYLCKKKFMTFVHKNVYALLDILYEFKWFGFNVKTFSTVKDIEFRSCQNQCSTSIQLQSKG